MLIQTTPRELRLLLQRQWRRGGCAAPLRTACWEIYDDGTLQPYNDPLVLDQDDGGPSGPSL